MSYQVLARKYRPRNFADVVGQDHAVKVLVNSLEKDRLHHAYLFAGTRGTGKTTLARILANCLNCEVSVTSTPCGKCRACEQMAGGTFIDLLEVDAASRTGVEDTRDLLNNVQYMPSQGRYKVYLIDEVHMLSTSSFNALLKTLEEPPPHVKFLFATTEPGKLPVTVLSRCLQFDLKNILPETISSYLRDLLDIEAIESDSESLSILAHAADGSMRDALSLTDQAIGYCDGSLTSPQVSEMLGTVRGKEVGQILKAFAEGDRDSLFECVADLASRAINLEEVLAAFQKALHDLAMSAATDTPPQQELREFAGVFAPEWIQLAYQVSLIGTRDMQYAPDARIGLEMTLIRLLDYEIAPPNVRLSQGVKTDRSISVKADASSEDALESSDKVESFGVDTDESIVERNDTTSTRVLDDRSYGEDLSDSEDWHRWNEELGAKGVTALILDNCNLVSRTDSCVELLLDEAHDALYNEEQKEYLSKIFAESIGHTVEVVVKIGSPTLETPGARKLRLKEEIQKDAESALQGNKNVNALIDEFGGKLDSVQPV